MLLQSCITIKEMLLVGPAWTVESLTAYISTLTLAPLCLCQQLCGNCQARGMLCLMQIKEAAIKLGYQPDETFCLKISQLREIFVVRWSVFLLGPAGCGKSAIWKTLMRAQQNFGEKTFFKPINPKVRTWVVDRALHKRYKPLVTLLNSMLALYCVDDIRLLLSLVNSIRSCVFVHTVKASRQQQPIFGQRLMLAVHVRHCVMSM